MQPPRGGKCGQCVSMWFPCGEIDLKVLKISKCKAESIQMSALHAQFYKTECSTWGSYVITLNTYYLDSGTEW